MIEYILWLQDLGPYIQDMGVDLSPYSCMAYIPVRFIDYKWKISYSLLIKSIWYLSMGITYVLNITDVAILVTCICFIEATDLFFQYLEKQNS